MEITGQLFPALKCPSSSVTSCSKSTNNVVKVLDLGVVLIEEKLFVIVISLIRRYAESIFVFFLYSCASFVWCCQSRVCCFLTRRHDGCGWEQCVYYAYSLVESCRPKTFRFGSGYRISLVRRCRLTARRPSTFSTKSLARVFTQRSN